MSNLFLKYVFTKLDVLPNMLFLVYIFVFPISIYSQAVATAQISYAACLTANEHGNMLLVENNSGVQESSSPLAELIWLLGKWQRVDSKPNQTGFEFWTRESSSKFAGSGTTLEGADTVFVEILSVYTNLQ